MNPGKGPVFPAILALQIHGERHGGQHHFVLRKQGHFVPRVPLLDKDQQHPRWIHDMQDHPIIDRFRRLDSNVAELTAGGDALHVPMPGFDVVYAYDHHEVVAQSRT